MIQLVVAFICPIVLTIVGLYLKKHINTDRGKSGYITKRNVDLCSDNITENLFKHGSCKFCDSSLCDISYVDW